MRNKPGVRWLGVKPELVVAQLIVWTVWNALGIQVDLWFTAGVDGTHKRSSKHNSGNAFDVRSKQLTPEQKRDFLSAAIAALGEDYDVILEAEGTEYEHFHVEYDPKKGYAS